MERRSGRGRQDAGKAPAPSSPTKRVVPRTEPRSPFQSSAAQQQVVVSASEIPAVESEEVVLNRRGMPARQRKRNRLYFDDDMVTPDNWGAAIARNAKKVKSEPQEIDTEEEGEEISDINIPTLSYQSPPKTPKRSSVSPTKGTKQGKGSTKESSIPPAKSNNKAVGRNSTSATDKSPPRGRGQPTLQLISATPEKSQSKGGRNSKGSKQVTFAVDFPQVKMEPVDPDDFQKKNVEEDKWTKMVQRKDKLKMEQEERASKGKKGKGQNLVREDSSEKRPSKKEQERDRQHQEKERQQKEKEKKQALQKEKAQQRAAELLQKENEKMALQKEKTKKRDHRDPISVLPPLMKVTPRGTYTTEPGESGDQRHHSSSQQILSQQQIMAFVKIDDPAFQTLDKRMAHDISIRLRNLLKLPKAHKWVCYEWFYSNIDKVLFEGENDFQICLKESFPTLKARKLTRTEWTKIRRLMGKPRRCSQAFFDEEREELAKRRAKIRQIQQRKVTDFSYKELPDEIPLQLVIGTKVTARLRRPQDGLFTGTIEGVDTSNNTYRITFDRPGLGTHSIPDYEVLSNDPPETVSTSSFALKIPRRSGQFTVGTFKFQNPALLGDQPEGFPKSPFPADGMLGGFPIRLLDMIVRLSKLLKAKREKIMTLKELNVEAEKLKSYGRPYNTEYKTRYAKCVLDLDSMNKEMGMYLEGIQTYCLEITNDHGSTTQMIIPEHILDSSRQEASMVVSTYNCKANRTLVHNQKIVGLVHHLTSLMLQVRALSTSDRNLYELKSLKDTIRDVKASLEGKNLQCFQNKIEIPMNRIIAGLCVSQPKAY